MFLGFVERKLSARRSGDASQFHAGEHATHVGERPLHSRKRVRGINLIFEINKSRVLHALELLTQMPILEFDSHETVLELIRLGATTNADLPDLLIGLSGKAAGCESTLTFDKGLGPTGLFERL